MVAEPEPTLETDIHAYQRDELLSLLKKLSGENASLIVHGQARLGPDDIQRILQKMRHGYGFSRRERSALTDAGFDLEQLFPTR